MSPERSAHNYGKPVGCAYTGHMECLIDQSGGNWNPTIYLNSGLTPSGIQIGLNGYPIYDCINKVAKIQEMDDDQSCSVQQLLHYC